MTNTELTELETLIAEDGDPARIMELAKKAAGMLRELEEDRYIDLED
jgi:hypothetical protein